MSLCVFFFIQSLLSCTACSSCPLEKTLLGQHADTCGVCVMRVGVWLWNLFVWMTAEFCIACGVCRVCVRLCPVESRGGGGCDVCLCRAVEAFDDLWVSACCSTSAAACVTFLSSEKVEHIIHRQGHTPSSHTPLLHAHNAHRRGRSCQLVPVCLPMSITARAVHLQRTPK